MTAQNDKRTRMEQIHELRDRADYMALCENDKEKFCEVLSQMHPRYRFGKKVGRLCATTEASIIHARLRTKLHFILHREDRRERVKLATRRYRDPDRMLNWYELNNPIEAQ